jgi:preprotein translocase subunit SecD
MTAREARQEGVPPGYRIYPADDDASGLLLREAPVLHGGELADVQADVSFRTQLAILTFRFNDDGTRKFAAFTRANIGQAFAIVVDGRVISAPIINEPVLGGAGEISGVSFTPDSVARLAARLRSPACTQISRRPAPGSASGVERS